MKLEVRNHGRNQQPIRVHIRHLVLEGIPVAGSAARLQAAVEAALSRRLATGGIARQLLRHPAVPSVPGGDLQAPPGLSPANLGARIARAIHASIAEPGTGTTTNREKA